MPDNATQALAQQTVGNAAVSRLVRGRATTARVQRYQAGDEGHGGIERQGLGPSGAGFSAGDARTAYSGNWLRDFSQLNFPSARPIIRTLFAGEFGRIVDDGELDGMLGTYVASEHLDNPAGGGTVEDTSADPEHHRQALERLSPEQRAAYDAENRHSGDIRLAHARSALPEYIERGKLAAKDTLKQAIVAGHTQQGLMLMGGALHAVEDYYSHSNFTEACILELQSRGDPAGERLAGLITQTPLGNNLGMLVPHGLDGRAEIQTGHYEGRANSAVSLPSRLTDAVS